MKLIQEFAHYMNAKGYSRSWVSTTTRLVTYFIDYANENKINIKKLTHYQLYDFETHLRNKQHYLNYGTISKSYIKHYFSSLSTFYEFLIDSKKVNINPLKSYKYPKPITQLRDILTQGEIKMVYEFVTKPKEKVILALAYGCGLRRSEMINLNVNDIDFNSGEIWVYGKGKKHTTVPMTHKVSQDIQQYIRVTNYKRKYESNTKKECIKPLIINKFGTRELGEGCNILLKKLIKKAGIHKNITLHSLRASIATHLLENGMSTEEIALFLRHSQIDTTQIYARFNAKK